MHNSGKEVHILIQHNFSRLVLQYNAYQVEGKHYSTTNSRYQSDTIHTKHSQRPYSHDHLLRISQHYMQSLSHYWIIPGVWAIIVPPLIPSIQALPRCTHNTRGNTIERSRKLPQATQLILTLVDSSKISPSTHQLLQCNHYIFRFNI